jgi:hypothetical protein
MLPLAVNRDGPQAFILAPDGNFLAFTAENDQIWALSLDASDIAPFYLQTTYHLRARSMRLFPNIVVDHQRLTKPEHFSLLPTVTGYTPGTLEVSYSFIHGIDVQLSCFIPEPDTLVGTINISNSAQTSITLDCEMVAILIPMGKGSPTHPERVGGNQILAGETDDLFPVLFMSAGPSGTNNPYPALCAEVSIEPGQSVGLHWALVSKTSQAASLKSARQWASPTWHKEAQIQIKSHAGHTIHITTGERDWDTAFYLAQANALTHLVNPDAEGSKPTFIRTRLPDKPMLFRPEIEALDNLTLLDILHLAQVILPAHQAHLSQLVGQFINRVDDQGMLASRVHRGFTGSPINEAPLLATLCLMLYEINQDDEFLRQAFPALRRFFDSGWLAKRDSNPTCPPHWENPAQLQLETGLFNFDIWDATGKGLDIRTTLSPALAAMLHREAQALQKIAQILGDRSARLHYGKIRKKYQDEILALWDDEQKLFTYRDLQSRRSPTREIYYPGHVQPQLSIKKHFIQPQRLQIHLNTADERTRACVVYIEGRDHEGEQIKEQFRAPELRWVAGQAHLTTHHLFSELISLSFEGFNQEDRFLIETADYSQPDISCFLPLWSGGLTKEQSTALINTHIDWLKPGYVYGIPETWPGEHPLPVGLREQVSVLWNSLIIDGLTREGLQQEAAAGFSNQMKAILHGLKDFKGFFPAHDLAGGFPQGQANAITGLAPLYLFLKISGIKLIRPDRVAIWGCNPFPWPIEVRWQGLWVRREDIHTQIIFPDGTQYQGQDTKPLVIQSDQRQTQI